MLILGLKGLKRGAGVGFPRWREAGETENNIITQYCMVFHNQKSAKRWQPTKKGWELGLKGRENHRITNVLLPCT